jgi:2-dehydro-3-deoxy-D-arabinonate dehydratase
MLRDVISSEHVSGHSATRHNSGPHNKNNSGRNNSRRMKLHHTSAGILLEQAGTFSLETALSWDALINREQLGAYLAQRHAELPRCAEAATLLQEALLPPMQGQELWCSGVTYLRSKVERQEESKGAGGGDFYQRVYDAERPELFFKATRHRVVGHGGKVRIRADSTWNVPEPELTLVLNRRGAIVGYTIGNDMSSRSIEGENPLYLPQAKTYDGCAAVGPCVYVTDTAFPTDARITLDIARAGSTVFSGAVAISMIRRSFTELAGFLFRECSFPEGALLMTGTGIVPPAPFTLQRGDEVAIAIDHIGKLVNQVA